MNGLKYALFFIAFVCVVEGGEFYKRLISIPNKAFDGVSLNQTEF